MKKVGQHNLLTLTRTSNGRRGKRGGCPNLQCKLFVNINLLFSVAVSLSLDRCPLYDINVKAKRSCEDRLF